MTEPTGPTPDQLRAVTEAQTPAEYMAAAQAAGLTGDAESAALAGARPVDAPDFAQLLAQYKADQQAQIDKLQADFEAQLAALRAGIPAPATDPRVSVARNLSDGITLLASQYPAATARLEPVARANGELAAAVADKPDGAETAVPDTALVQRVISTFRRFAAANPALESGLIEHAAQIAEDVFEL